jgi:hypothetical protein
MMKPLCTALTALLVRQGKRNFERIVASSSGTYKSFTRNGVTFVAPVNLANIFESICLTLADRDPHGLSLVRRYVRRVVVTPPDVPGSWLCHTLAYEQSDPVVSMEEAPPEECGKVVRVAVLARLSVLSRGRVVYRNSPWRKVAYRREIETLEKINAREDYLQAMRLYYAPTIGKPGEAKGSALTS